MPRINQMFAFIVADKDEDDEGIPAITLPNGMWAPLVGADEDRMISLRGQAQAIAAKMGKPVTLARFITREDEEVIYPDGTSSLTQ